MDTEEMYQRGIADAENGEPHPFYYQHYYQYRRGYDRARRSLGLPGGFYDVRRRRIVQAVAVALIVASVAGGYWFWRDRGGAAAVARNTNQPLSAPAVTLTPSHTPIFATPTTPPSPTPASLQVGGSATIVNIAGSALRSRKLPSLNAPTTASFKLGETVRILEGPAEADGFTWWKIEGQGGAGWSAQQSKDGVIWLQPAN